MHEAVKKGPKKDVGEEAAKETVREDNVALLEVRLILQAVLLQHKQAQYPVGDEKEEKSVEPRQSQNARRGARQECRENPPVIHRRQILHGGQLVVHGQLVVRLIIRHGYFSPRSSIIRIQYATDWSNRTLGHKSTKEF